MPEGAGPEGGGRPQSSDTPTTDKSSPLTAGPKQLDVSTMTAVNIRDARILVVAGPSGSGKTTFIDALKAGALSSAIRDLLPTGSEHWPIAGVTRAASADAERFKAWAAAARETGLILHYDNAFIYRSGAESYAYDGAMGLFRLGSCPTFVSIRPSLAQLAAQHRGRKDALYRAKPLPHRLWRLHVRDPLRAFIRRVSGGVDSTDLYSSPEWLATCYSRWDAAVAELVHDKPLARVLTVEPCDGAEAQGSFRLIDRPAG